MKATRTLLTFEHLFFIMPLFDVLPCVLTSHYTALLCPMIYMLYSLCSMIYMLYLLYFMSYDFV